MSSAAPAAAAGEVAPAEPGVGRLKCYPVASPDSPRVFQRVPFKERTHWLLLWDTDNDPANVSCTTAFNTLGWAATMGAVTRALYNTGDVKHISAAIRDFNTCLDVTSLRGKNPAAARARLEALQAEKEVETPHIFTFRSEPRVFGLLDFSRIALEGSNTGMPAREFERVMSNEEKRRVLEGNGAGAGAGAAPAADDAAAAAAAPAAAAGKSWWRFW